MFVKTFSATVSNLGKYIIIKKEYLICIFKCLVGKYGCQIYVVPWVLCILFLTVCSCITFNLINLKIEQWDITKEENLLGFTCVQIKVSKNLV